MTDSRRVRFWAFYGLPALFTAILVAGSVFAMWYFQVKDWDFSHFTVLPWNIWHGYGWHVPLHEIDTGIPFYAHHWQAFTIVLAPLLGILDTPYALSVVHGLALGTWFFLLPHIVRIIFEEAGRRDYEYAALFMVIFLFFWYPFLGPWRYQTHITTLVSPAIFLAVIALHKGRPWLAFLCCIIVISGQERASLGVFSIGMYAALVLRRYKAGAAICAFACAYFIGIVKIWFPWLRGGLAYHFSKEIAGFVNLKPKFMFVFKYMAYTMFLPLVGRKAILSTLCTAPMMGLTFIADRHDLRAFGHHYQDMAAPFVLIAATYGILWLCEHHVFERCGRVVLYPTAAAVFAVSLWISSPSHPFTVSLKYLRQVPPHEIALLHDDMRKLWNYAEGQALWVESGLGPIVSLRTERYALTGRHMADDFTRSVVAISPICVKGSLGGGYAEAQRRLDANPSLKLAADTGRLRVYASRDSYRDWPVADGRP